MTLHKLAIAKKSFLLIKSVSVWLWTVLSSRLEDSSELVKTELARIIGHLSCIQSELSSLSEPEAGSEHLYKTIYLRLRLTAEHAGNSCASLKANFVRPFLPLLIPEVQSGVKQGTPWISILPKSLWIYSMFYILNYIIYNLYICLSNPNQVFWKLCRIFVNMWTWLVETATPEQCSVLWLV